MKKLLIATLVSLFFVGPLPAFAHASDAQVIVAAHGGQVRKVGPNFVELVAKDGEITLYFTDANKNKINTEFGQAKATVRYGEERQTVSVDLKSATGNTLQGTGDFVIKPNTTIVVFVKLDGEDAHGGRFVLNSTAEQKQAGHHHDDHDHDHDTPHHH